MSSISNHCDGYDLVSGESVRIFLGKVEKVYDISFPQAQKQKWGLGFAKFYQPVLNWVEQTPYLIFVTDTTDMSV